MVGKLTSDFELSASRTPVLLNASPYQTRNELLAEMIKLDEGGEKEWFDQNQAMYWGDTLEPVILREAAKRLGLTNVEIDIDTPYHHDHLPFAASLDGTGVGHKPFTADWGNGIYVPQGGIVETAGQGVLEAKLTSARPEDIPAPHRGPLQLQAQMMCTGLSYGCVAVLYQGTELRLFLYRADEVIQNRIREAIIDFENRRKNIDWYPITSPEDGAVAYSRTDDDAPPLELDGDDAAWVDHLMTAKANKAMAEREIDIATAAIMDKMGSHDTAFASVGNRRVQVKWPTRKMRAQPERITPAKPETVMRQKTLTLKEID